LTAGRHINTKSSNWCTPKKYVDAVYMFFKDAPKLDPCSNLYSIVNAKIEYCLPINGLKETWNYPTIYVNPPYGRGIIDWIAKCYNTNQKYGSEILLLVPVATNTKHWKNYIFQANGICFLADTRLKFLIDGKEGGKGAPMACAMVYWGKNIQYFNTIFNQYGTVIHVEKK
jgi:hypothetical protein